MSAMQAMHESTISCGYNDMNLTKPGEFHFIENDLFCCYIKQIMNVFHLCNGKNIFIRWKIKCSIQLSFALLNRTFHLSAHENICTIALINIHCLYTHTPCMVLSVIFSTPKYGKIIYNLIQNLKMHTYGIQEWLEK